MPVAEDAHWRWNQKMDATAGQLAFRHYAIEHENSTEGLMMIALVGHQSRMHSNKDTVYVDYLSVAPQNRLIIQRPPKFKAVKSILFNYSIQLDCYAVIESDIIHTFTRTLSKQALELDVPCEPELAHQDVSHY